MQSDTSYSDIHADLVLIGSGHTNLDLLHRLNKKKLPGVRITLITNVMNATYSGMLSGYITGDLTFDETHIDVNRLSKKMNIRVFHSSVTELDPENRLVHCDNRPPVRYDYLTINCGSVQNTENTPGSEEFALRIRPLDVFLKKIDSVIERIKTFRGVFHLLVVGGGASGVELSIALRTRINYEMQSINLIPDTVKIFLCIPDEKILPRFNRRSAEEAEKILKSKNVFILNHSRIITVNEDNVGMSDRKQMSTDAVIFTTDVTAPEWVKKSGLETDSSGFIKVFPTLRSIQYSNIFVGGDVASFEKINVDKSGVYAVRMAEILAENIHNSLSGHSLRKFSPQKKALYILGVDKEVGVLNYGTFSFSGKWVKKFKYYLDSKYIRKNTFPPLSKIDVKNNPDVQQMRCGGCGGKIGYRLLSETVRKLDHADRQDIVSNLDALTDSSCIKVGDDKYLYQSVDFFRQLTDDPYIFGKLTALHCMNDLYASKVRPHSAMAILGVPHGEEKIQQRDISAMLNGITDILAGDNATLIGGHTAETAEFSLGLSVNGFSSRPPEKGAIDKGLDIILTKKIGSGILFSADHNGDCPGKYKEECMAELLIPAKHVTDIIFDRPKIWCTDVTGFGLLGSLYNLLDQSPKSVRINLEALPVFGGVESCLASGYLSSMDEQNNYFESFVETDPDVKKHPLFRVLFDPQTAGPLLILVPKKDTTDIISRLNQSHFSNASVIGEVETDADTTTFYLSA